MERKTISPCLFVLFSCSVVSDSLRPRELQQPGFSVLHCLPQFAQTPVHESVMPSHHVILCRPLLLLPSVFPSIRVFSNESALRIRWPEYWSFSFSVSPCFPTFCLRENSLLQSQRARALSLTTGPAARIWCFYRSDPARPLAGNPSPASRRGEPRPPRGALSFTEMETEPRKDSKDKISRFTTSSLRPRTLHSLQR